MGTAENFSSSDQGSTPGSSQAGDSLEDLREHAASLRQRLQSPPPTQSASRLNRDMRQVQADIQTLTSRNLKLQDALKEARQQLELLQAEIDRLAEPPSRYGIFYHSYPDDSADIFTGGRRMRLNCSPGLDHTHLIAGQTVRINEAMTVVAPAGFESLGTLCTLRDLLDDHRAVVHSPSGEEYLIRLAGPLIDDSPNDNPDHSPLKSGDTLLVDLKAGFAFERIAKAEVQQLLLEEVPNITYHDIGGLSHQIDQIRDAVELPFMHKDLYSRYNLHPPKGVLLYGPPGCGKTLIAKAVANSLAQQIATLRGDDPHAAKSYFINIKGPELLNKFVGETERHIRLIFQQAREKSSEGTPVIIFFDEMDSVFRTRGTGISSDVETTIVPQLLTEIDGVEQLENVIIIGASNREDMIDPAILRPGRLDVKIKIERPNQDAARDIFSKYLTSDLPLAASELACHHGDPQACINAMIEMVVQAMYQETDENRFLEVTYANGDKEILYFKDVISGAMIANIVDRAKKKAIKAFLQTGQEGITSEQLRQSLADEFRENEDLPNTTNPDDWARISGKKGERIIYIRPLITSKDPSWG